MLKTQPEDSETISKPSNGTNLWISRGRPIAIIVLVLAPFFIWHGVVTTRVSHLEEQMEKLEQKVSLLERKSPDGAILLGQINDAQAWARTAHDKLVMLKASLIQNGTLETGTDN